MLASAEPALRARAARDARRLARALPLARSRSRLRSPTRAGPSVRPTWTRSCLRRWTRAGGAGAPSSSPTDRLGDADRAPLRALRRAPARRPRARARRRDGALGRDAAGAARRRALRRRISRRTSSTSTTAASASAVRGAAPTAILRARPHLVETVERLRHAHRRRARPATRRAARARRQLRHRPRGRRRLREALPRALGLRRRRSPDRALEQFDADRDAEALARFDALDGRAGRRRASRTRRARAGRVRAAAGASGDWDGVIASLRPRLRAWTTGAPLVGRLRSRASDFVANLRLLCRDRSRAACETEPLATRGERLALFRVRFAGATEAGGRVRGRAPLRLVEATSDGRWLALVVFDPRRPRRRLRRARRALRRRRGRRRPARRRWLRAFAAPSPRATGTAVAALLRARPRRARPPAARLGDAARRGGVRRRRCARWSSSRPTSQLRIDHVALSQRGLAVRRPPGWARAKGGPFEAPSIIVTELDADGADPAPRPVRRRPARRGARALAELVGGARHAPRFENAATRARRAGRRRVERARLGAFRGALRHRPFASLDRRQLVQLELDRDEHLARMRDSSRWTRGGAARSARDPRRPARARPRPLAGRRPHGRPERDRLRRGRSPSMPRRAVGDGQFDPDDLDAAYAELDERFAAGEGAAAPRPGARRDVDRGVRARDWDALAALLAPSLEVARSPTLGWEIVGGAEHVAAAALARRARPGRLPPRRPRRSAEPG